MDRVEEIGEATVKVLSRAFYYVLGALIWLIGASRKLGGKVNFYSLFKRRNVELKDYVVLKAQAVTLVFLAASVGFVFGLLSARVLAIIAAFGVYSLYLTMVQIKEHFRSDYPAYKAFFLSYFAISVLLVVVKVVKPSVNFIFPYLHFLLISVVCVLGASYFFKRKYARKYTFGRVTKGGDFMTVKVNYDLLSSVKPGVHTFENRTGAKEGDVVKILVESSGLNIGGSRVVGPVPSD